MKIEVEVNVPSRDRILWVWGDDGWLHGYVPATRELDDYLVGLVSKKSEQVVEENG